MYLSCPGYFENTWKHIMYYYRSGVEWAGWVAGRDSEGNAHFFLQAPSTPCRNSTCCFPVFNKNCRVCRSWPIRHWYYHSSTHWAVPCTRCIYVSDCYAWDGGWSQAYCAEEKCFANRSVQFLSVCSDSSWNATTAAGKPSLTLNDD